MASVVEISVKAILFLTYSFIERLVSDIMELVCIMQEIPPNERNNIDRIYFICTDIVKFLSVF